MRKLDILAEEQYGGDTIKAITDIINKEQFIDEYVSEMTKEEAEVTFSLITDYVAKKNGGHKAFEEKILIGMDMEQLNLTEEDVKLMPRNFYKSHIIKGIVFVLLATAVSALCLVFAEKIGSSAASVLAVAGSTATGIAALNLSNSIIKHFKFKKIKDYFDRQYVLQKKHRY